jgi:hypothetical protein
LAKANIVLPNGTSVVIEGTTEEVAELLAKFSHAPISEKRDARPAQKRKAGKKGGGKAKSGPTGLIAQLGDEGYFKAKRTIGEIRKKLEEGGHIYPLTSISPILTRLTKRRVLRRLKENNVWKYVG